MVDDTTDPPSGAVRAAVSGWLLEVSHAHDPDFTGPAARLGFGRLRGHGQHRELVDGPDHERAAHLRGPQAAGTCHEIRDGLAAALAGVLQCDVRAHGPQDVQRPGAGRVHPDAANARLGDHRVEETGMGAVNAVEIADRDDAAGESGGKGVEGVRPQRVAVPVAFVRRRARGEPAEVGLPAERPF